MRIGIDIDDVITDTSKEMMKYFELYGQNIDFENPLNSKVNILRGKFATDEVKQFVKKYGTEIAAKAECRENARETIEKLQQQQNEIFIITAREEPAMQDINRVTKEYLKDNNISFDELFMGIYDKKTFCRNNKIDVMIEDSIETCKDLIETRTIPLLFTTGINREFEILGVDTVKDWNQVYEKIQHLIKREQSER